VIGHSRSPPEPRVAAGVQELTEMTIGRIDDPENPSQPVALEVAQLFGTGSRIPSGPAVMMPRQQAEDMIAIDPPVRILFEALEPKGPSTHGCGFLKARDFGRKLPGSLASGDRRKDAFR